jgi:hypothetical protein
VTEEEKKNIRLPTIFFKKQRNEDIRDNRHNQNYFTQKESFFP